MPIDWSLDPEARLIQFTWRDPYTFEEWALAMSEILARPCYEPGFRFRVDRRYASPPSTEFVRNMAVYFDAHRDKLQGVRAALIVHDDAGFGMARMTELAATGRNPAMTVRVFRDADQAEHWLEFG